MIQGQINKIIMGFFDLFGNSKEESPEELLRKKLSEAFDNGVRYAVNEPSSRAVINEPVLGALLVKGAIANMYQSLKQNTGLAALYREEGLDYQAILDDECRKALGRYLE
jgi:hypothetical protein